MRFLGMPHRNWLLCHQFHFGDYASMIFGVNATKSAVVIVETKGAADKFAITAIRPIPFEVRSGDDLGELLWWAS
jgi:hypothetical protein